MSKYVTVRVTQEDIDANGSGAYSCPIARALNRAGYPNAAVYVPMWAPDRYAPGRAPVTRVARAFINAYDFDKPVKPTTFRLPLPATAPRGA